MSFLLLLFQKWRNTNFRITFRKIDKNLPFFYTVMVVAGGVGDHVDTLTSVEYLNLDAPNTWVKLNSLTIPRCCWPQVVDYIFYDCPFILDCFIL